MNVEGKCVLVVGLGQSGRAVARLLANRGASVTVTDLRSESELGTDLSDLRDGNVRLVLGGHPDSLFTAADQIVVSPGVPPLSGLSAAERAGIPIASEVEIASWFIQGRVVGITGTNGKSTVTSMVGAMCERTGRPTFVGGNLGTPLIEVVDSPAAAPDGLVVVELSSFQLERVERLHVSVAALLNLSADHLDRYPSLDAYAAAKQNLFHCQRPEDAAIAPAGDARCEALVSVSAGRQLRFLGDGDVREEAGCLVDTQSGLLFPLSGLQLAGRHNAANACAAALIAREAGVEREHIEEVLATFSGLPHRMQHVADLRGVTYYDDSKATNVGAAVASLVGVKSTSGRVVLIAGGKDKGGGYAPLTDALRPLGRGAVLIGEAASLIEQTLAPLGIPLVRAASMSDAVEQAARLAQPGDVVLLAPACSSFDMFASYRERGERFQAAVRARDEAKAWE